MFKNFLYSLMFFVFFLLIFYSLFVSIPFFLSAKDTLVVCFGFLAFFMNLWALYVYIKLFIKFVKSLRKNNSQVDQTESNKKEETE